MSFINLFICICISLMTMTMMVCLELRRQAVAQEFGVQAMPTFVLLKQGKELERVIGAKKDELEKKILKHRAV